MPCGKPRDVMRLRQPDEVHVSRRDAAGLNVSRAHLEHPARIQREGDGHLDLTAQTRAQAGQLELAE
jgi:hypothetical protein